MIYKIDVEETEEKVKQYEKQNRDSIAANSARAAAEARILAQNEILLKRQKQEAREAAIREHQKEKERREQVEQQIIFDLATSGKDPNKIIQLSDSLKKQQENIASSVSNISRSSSILLSDVQQVAEDTTPFSPLAGEKDGSKYFSYSKNTYQDL